MQGTGSSARSRAGSLRSLKERAANGVCPTDMSWGKRPAVPGSLVCVTVTVSCTPKMPATVGSTGKVPRSVSILVATACARTMMLVYDLPATDAIYRRFIGIDGSAYFVGGLGMTALTFNNVVVVPIRSGVGLRLGANIGYLKFTPSATWNPF